MVCEVLVVDDSAVMRKLIALTLSRTEYKPTFAVNGDEALKILEWFSPAIVLLDVRMPVMDGFELCRIIRKKQYDMRVIFLTSLDNDIDYNHGLEVGGDVYLIKPFSPAKLVAAIDEQYELWQSNKDISEMISPQVLQKIAHNMSDLANDSSSVD